MDGCANVVASPFSFPMHARMHGGGGEDGLFVFWGGFVFRRRETAAAAAVSAGLRRTKEKKQGMGREGDWREDEPGTKEGSSLSVRPSAAAAVSDVHDASKRFRGSQGRCFYAFGLGRRRVWVEMKFFRCSRLNNYVQLSVNKLT